jgi:acetyl esterase
MLYAFILSQNLRRLALAVLLALCAYIPSLAQSCKTGVLDPRVKTFLSYMGPELTLEQLRAVPIEVLKNAGPPEYKKLPEESVQRIRITADSIRVNVVKAVQGQNLPVIINYHGGGFISPLLPWMEYEALELSGRFNAVVFDVDYRVAPEYPFPVPVNDSYAAFKWISTHARQFGGDVNKIILIGNSAGANLVAMVSQKAKKEGLHRKIKLQVMNCPVVDNPINHQKYPSYQENASGYMLTKANAFHGLEVYGGAAANHANPELLPILATDVSGLPPAVIITAEFDILRDEGYSYAEKLRKAGVAVSYKCFPHQIHCLAFLPEDAEEKKEMYNLMEASIKKALAGKAQ